jgi:hypothetical protein
LLHECFDKIFYLTEYSYSAKMDYVDSRKSVYGANVIIDYIDLPYSIYPQVLHDSKGEILDNDGGISVFQFKLT